MGQETKKKTTLNVDPGRTMTDVDMAEPTAQTVRKLRRAMLAWYDVHHRKLPWRSKPSEAPNPYHVLVSEAMLQQTQVATVIDYFQRFVRRFPTIQALAAADQQQVLRLWQGLGYYRRARHLHKAAQQIVRDENGRVPDSVDCLLGLPGVGPYTAGAIASIAFGQRAAVLDGNVTRVLSRWNAIDQPLHQPATQMRLKSLANKLVPRNRPGDFNQALMELGAVICLPRRPSCHLCPIGSLCRAKRLGIVLQLPVKTRRSPPQRVTHNVLAVKRAASYLFEQRPNTGLWAAMWQMPTLERTTSRPGCGVQLQEWVLCRFSLTVTPPCHVGHFTHQTTHRTIRFVLWAATVQSGRLRPTTGRWRHLDQIDDLPLANPQRRIASMLV